VTGVAAAYPALTSLAACHVLAIPGCSLLCESLFSAAGLVVCDLTRYCRRLVECYHVVNCDIMIETAVILLLILATIPSVVITFWKANHFSICNQPHRSTQPGHPFMVRSSEYWQWL